MCLGSVPFFFLDENVEGGGEAGFSVPRICSAGALKEGFALLSVPLDAAFLFFFAVVGGVFKRLMF